MDALRQEFIRLPKPKTKCPKTGLSRTSMYNLVVPCKANDWRPPVPARCKKSHPKAQRGIWLAPLHELLSYLDNLPTSTAQPQLIENNPDNLSLAQISKSMELWDIYVEPDLDLDPELQAKRFALTPNERLQLLKKWGFTDRL